jgi:hypothetical protein
MSNLNVNEEDRMATPEELKLLQAEQARKNTTVGYIDALNTIATSLAGKQADMGADQFRDQNAQKVKDYLLRKQAERKAVEQGQADAMFNRQQKQMDAQDAENSSQKDPANPTAQIVHKMAVQAGMIPSGTSPMSLYAMKQAGIEPAKVLTDIKAARAAFENSKSLRGMDYGQQEKMAGINQTNDMAKMDIQHGNNMEMAGINSANQLALQGNQIASNEKMAGNEIAAREKLAAVKPVARPTADQYKAAGFAVRMKQSEDIFDSLVNGGYNRADYTSSVAAGGVPQSISSEEWRQQDQAELNFLLSVLRRESGAAISPSEIETGTRQYFPRAGDSEKVLAQKKANRELVTRAMSQEAGDAIGGLGVPTPLSDDVDITQFKRKTNHVGSDQNGGS